jgi:pyridoxine kinase
MFIGSNNAYVIFLFQVVHTVSFSNHTGYGRFGGWKATRDDLSTVFGHMRQNGLLKSGRLLTGT